MFGNRGIYYQGWSAVTKHKYAVGHGRRSEMPPSTTTSGSCTTARQDWSQAHDLKEQPEATSLLAQATATLADRGDQVQRHADGRPHRRAHRAQLAGRPTLVHGNTQMFFPGMGRLSRTACSASRTSRSPHRRDRGWQPPANGVIIAQGGRFGGWSVYARMACLKFVYNVLGIDQFPTSEGDAVHPDREHQVRMEFAYDGGGLARAATSRSTMTASRSAAGRVEATQAMVFSADETTGHRLRSGHAGVAGL
jgi:hypothetical protein